MRSKFYLVVVVIVVALALLAGVFVSTGRNVSAAPVAAPTPISVTERGGTPPQVVTFFSAEPLTSDTTSTCIEASAWDVADLYYTIDQGTTNTTTLNLKFGNSATALVDGINIVASNTADASDLQQFQLFGRFACVYANVSNTNTITITVNALVK